MGTFGIPGISGNPPSTPPGLGIEVGGAFVLPVGGKVFFVRGNGTTATYYDDWMNKLSTKDMSGGLYPSVASALGQCTSGRGDRIIVLPGHTENLAAATAWTFVDNVEIIGVGVGDTRPTFTFTVAAATLVVNKKGVRISNCRFLCAGPAGTTALTVTAPFTASGEGVVFDDNYFQVAIDNDQLCTTFMTITGTNVMVIRNEVESLVVAGEITDVIVLTGADGVVISDNYMKVTVGVAQGLIRSLTTASKKVRIERNFFYSWKASSTSCINFTAALANTGIVANNRLRVTTDGGVAHIGVNAAGDLSLYLNYGVNNVNESGLAIGTAST
jgi:hypothetical protein